MRPIINSKICIHLQDTGKFRPIHCALCVRQRSECENWLMFVNSSPTVEVGYDPDNPDHERV